MYARTGGDDTFHAEAAVDAFEPGGIDDEETSFAREERHGVAYPRRREPFLRTDKTNAWERSAMVSVGGVAVAERTHEKEQRIRPEEGEEAE